jgi:hypothetical protein
VLRTAQVCALVAATAAAPKLVAVEARAQLAAETAFREPLEPPAEPGKPVLPDGRLNWSAGYIMQSMVYLLQATGEERWARELVGWGTAMLAHRDAPHPRDRRPYSWTDRSRAVKEPYVWAGFTGHIFAPLMEFARHVAERPDLARKTVQGRSFAEHAASFMQEFERALEVHDTELAEDKRRAFFRFAKPVPVANRRIQGQPLPVNMNATLFTAMLHLSKATESDRPQDAKRLHQQVERFVRYLDEDVLERSPCGRETCVTWRYSTYINRAEDVGHANVVVKFLIDAHSDGYPVDRADLIGVAMSIGRLVDENGTFRSNLLDGSTIPGSRDSIYFHILLGRHSPSLKAKLLPIVVRTKNFAYWGPWLRAER